MTSFETFGHAVPPFSEVLVDLLRRGLAEIDLGEIDRALGSVPDADRRAIASYLGPEALTTVAEGFDETRRTFVERHVQAGPPVTESEARERYPRVMAALHGALSIPALGRVLDALPPETLASQAIFLGNRGRKVAFSTLPTDAVETILNRTADWVLLAAGKAACDDLHTYTCTLVKQERIGKKMQDRETIQVKYREDPKALYLKWVDGPFKGREVLYNPARLGRGNMRVREAGLLGVLPVTLPADSPVARRGTKHTCTELGLRHMLALIADEYAKAAPRGHIDRVPGGIVRVGGRSLYRLEVKLPRDRAHGYYCQRMVCHIDYVNSLAVRAEIYDFDGELDESYEYLDIAPNAPLVDADFDPANRAYRLR